VDWPVYGYYELVLTNRIEKTPAAATSWTIQLAAEGTNQASTGPIYTRGLSGTAGTVYSGITIGSIGPPTTTSMVFYSKIIRIMRLANNELFIFEF
jgi:hypothetical protein